MSITKKDIQFLKDLKKKIENEQDKLNEEYAGLDKEIERLKSELTVNQYEHSPYVGDIESDISTVLCKLDDNGEAWNCIDFIIDKLTELITNEN